jgi:AmmeMemoRadiSam system protein A
MPDDQLSPKDRAILLNLAREAIGEAVLTGSLVPLKLEQYSKALTDPGASFVTLTKAGQLRGCVGTLEAYRALVEDVREHAVAAAVHDYRFPPVSQQELSEIAIEISRLTKPVPLNYNNPQNLVLKLRPGLDGVVIKHGTQRATFLPQVWEKLPDPVIFMNHLCQKMGATPDLWCKEMLEVLVYTVEEFRE